MRRKWLLASVLRSAPNRGSEHIDDDLGLLNPALELAVARARRDATTPDAPAPPAALRPVLRFTRLPNQALRAVQQVLDRDAAFRARVAEGASEDDLGRASWLFLNRPDGWADELALLQAAANEAAAESSATRSEQTAERRLAQVEDTLGRVRSELDASLRAGIETDRALAESRATTLALEHARDALTERLVTIDDERGRAVRNLKEAEARGVTRLDELRAARRHITELESDVAALTAAPPVRAALEPLVAAPDTASQPSQPSQPTVPPTQSTVPAPTPPAVSSPWDRTDPATVARAVQAAAAAAATLGAALDQAARSLTATATAPAPTLPEPTAVEVSPSPSDTSEPGQDRGPRPPRRSPIRMQRGAHEGTVEGVEQVLATPEVVVIVDGYNVSMEAWPLLDSSAQRSSLIALLGALQARIGASVHVVFDGDDDGRRPSVGAPLPVRVHFSHAEVEADDVVLEMVARLPTDRPVVVVSSDRRVQDGARRLGANIVKSAELLSLTRA